MKLKALVSVSFIFALIALAGSVSVSAQAAVATPSPTPKPSATPRLEDQEIKNDTEPHNLHGRVLPPKKPPGTQSPQPKL